jgi:hypothetical protein
MRPNIPPICRFHRRRNRRHPLPVHGQASTLGLALVPVGNETPTLSKIGAHIVDKAAR